MQVLHYMRNLYNYSDTLCSHNGGEEVCFMVFDVVWFGRYLLTYRRNVLSPSSGRIRNSILKEQVTFSSEILITIHQTTWHHVSEGSNDALITRARSDVLCPACESVNTAKVCLRYML